jgi:anti-sigma B factor antagonist
MKLTTEKNGAELTVRLNGEVNANTAPELSAFFNEELPGVQALTLDFAECDYVSSAGLRVLLTTFKRMKAADGSMSFANVGKGLMDVFQITGLARVFGLQ